MRKLRKGDEVVVITGKAKGVRGAVQRVIDNKKVIVEGAHLVKKHVKANPQAGIEGGIIEREAPIDISNVAIYNPQTEKADRVGFKTLEDGRKIRIYKSNQEQIDIN